MSADNGIYILETEGPEFRVAHLQAIENLDAPRCPVHGAEFTMECEHCSAGYSDDADNSIANAREMFARSFTAPNRNEALRIAADMLERTPVCEYGIHFIKIPRKF